MAQRPDLPPRYARLISLSERDPRRAAKLAQRILAADATPWAHYTLGLILLRSERISQAEPHISTAAASGALIPGLRYAALVVRQLSGEGVTLQVAWAELIAAQLDAGRLSEAARALNEQIAHLNVLGQHQEAYELAIDHDELVQAQAPPADQARYAHVLGVAAGGRSDLPAAHAALDQAAATYRALHRPVDVARVRFERAWLHVRRENHVAARFELEQALATFRRFDLPIRVALCQKDLATIACFSADYSAALAYIAHARTAAMAFERRDVLAYCEQNLGIIAHYSGLWDLALAAYARAQAIYRERGQERLRLMCERNRAMVLNEQQRFADSLALLDAIIAPVQALADQIEIAEVMAVRARALHGLERTPEALAELTAAEQQFRQRGNVAAAAECLLNAGWIALDSGDHPTADNYFQAIGAELLTRPAHRWRLAHGRGLVAAAQGDSAAALDQFYAAGAAVATMRRRFASEHASSALFTQARRLYTDALQLAARTGNAVQVAAFAEQQRTLLVQQRLAGPLAAPPAIQQRREQAREQLQAAAATPTDAAGLETALQAYIDALLQARHLAPPTDLPDQPFDLQYLRERLTHAYGNDWSLLAPIPVGAELYLLLITPSTIALTTQPYDAALRGLLTRARTQRLRSDVYRDLTFLRGAAPRAWRDLRTLAEQLLPPQLRERLHPAHRLLIVPGGPFHALPWAALRLADGWLAEQAIIQYLPTLMPAQVPALDRHGPALLLGCATFGARAPDLPSAIACLDVAQAHWHGPTTRIEAAQATRSAVLEYGQQGRLRTTQLVHIASHAVAGEFSGLLAHVMLADTNLWVDDITRLNLDGGLVVLAACAGAASEVLPGDELVGVGRAFLAAGATGVLASFWPIYDRTVLPMVEGFYAELARHADPALALAMMQRRLLADTTAPEVLRTPYIWGCFGFTSVGVMASITAL